MFYWAWPCHFYSFKKICTNRLFRYFAHSLSFRYSKYYYAQLSYFKIMFIFFILPLLYETMHTIAPKDKHKHGNHHTGTPLHYLYSICLLFFFTTSWSWFARLLSKSIKSFITTHAMFSAFHECEKMVNHMTLMEWQMLIEDLTELLSDKCLIAATMTFIHIH